MKWEDSGDFLSSLFPLPLLNDSIYLSSIIYISLTRTISSFYFIERNVLCQYVSRIILASCFSQWRVVSPTGCPPPTSCHASYFRHHPRVIRGDIQQSYLHAYMYPYGVPVIAVHTSNHQGYQPKSRLARPVAELLILPDTRTYL